MEGVARRGRLERTVLTVGTGPGENDSDEIAHAGP
jgi:hypothetical protein